MSGEPEAAATARKPTGAGCLAVFGAVFLLAGLGMLVPFFLLPAKRALETRSWRGVPCTVLASQVETVRGDDSDTYRVEVLFEYVVDGRTYRSDRYDFLIGSTGGRSGKQAIVDRNPPGTRTVCWVDPDDPAEAVFSRAWRAGWLVSLLPLLFAAAGAGVIVAAWRTARGGGAAAAAAAARRRIERTMSTGPVTVRPRTSPLGKLAGTLFVALFWNGIVSVFVWQVVEGWRTGGGVEGCLALFLVPFVLIGLVLLVAVPYQLLALFNPRPSFTLSRTVLAPGDSVHLEWRLTGLPGRIRKLRIALEGREETAQEDGAARSGKAQTFATVVVVETEERTLIPHGSRLVGVPADARPSGEGPDGRVRWLLTVRGEIAFWPDVSEEIELEVLPRE
jgi:Protein of unknown function (DUF3592)